MRDVQNFFLRNKHLFILLTILAFAFILRTIHLTTNPVALNQDEAVNGYDAYALGKTLMDHHGHFLPPLLESFQDWGSTFLTYLTVPFVHVLGLSVENIRLVTVILGVGSIGLFYIFLRQLSFSEELALIGSFLLAIEPWHITISRWALPPSAVPFTLLLFIVSFLWAIKFVRNKSAWVFLIPAITGALLTYSYQTQRLFAPLLVFIVGIIYLRKRFLNLSILFITYAVIISPIYILTLSNPAVNASFQGLSILWRPNPIIEFVKNYLNFFSPYFHFQGGDPNIMHHVPGVGSSYDFLSLFFYLGIALCILGLFKKVELKNFTKEIYLLILSWTFLFPLSASLTFYPTVLRVIHGLPLIIVFFIITLSFVRQNVRKSYFVFICLVTVILGFLEVFTFMKIYLYEYPKISYKEFQYGIEEYQNYLFDHEKDFDKVVIDNSINKPYIYYLFYGQIDPKQLKYSDPEKSSNKYTFENISDLNEDGKKIIKEFSFGSTILYRIYTEGRTWYLKKI